MNAELGRLRRQHFYNNLSDGEALILFAGSPPRKSADVSYRFFANRNFFYLTGILQQGSIFLAVKHNGEIEESLYIHKKNRMEERWHGYRISTEEAAEISGVATVRELDVFDRTLAGLIYGGTISTLWYDFDKFDAGAVAAPQNAHCASVQTDCPAMRFQNAYPAICTARTLKSPEEITCIREAMCVTRDGIHAMMQAARVGMYEYQLEAVFNKVLADAGVREPAFANIVSSGRNNFYIHYEEPRGLLNDGDLILTDVGARLHEYATDISRAFPVNGSFSAAQREVYNIALMVNKELMSLLKPGEVSFADIEAHARRRVGEELVAAGYLEADEDVSKYYWHNGTHHLGLDVHDVGPAGDPIAPGMVFTIDVGIYIEDKNIGFRVEDDVAITETGCEHLSIDIVREIDEIEAIMT